MHILVHGDNESALHLGAALSYFKITPTTIVSMNLLIVKVAKDLGYESMIPFDFKGDDMDLSLTLSDGKRVIVPSEIESKVFYFKSSINAQVYIDMDGVVSDFEKGVKDMFDMSTKDTGFWEKIYSTLEEPDSFFFKLEKMKDVDKLLDRVKDYNPIFLSSTGFRKHYPITTEKTRWINKHFPGYQLITVDRSIKKALYAASNALLIDDRPKSILPFMERGGDGILHTSVEDTLLQLDKVLKKFENRITIDDSQHPNYYKP